MQPARFRMRLRRKAAAPARLATGERCPRTSPHQGPQQESFLGLWIIATSIADPLLPNQPFPVDADHDQSLVGVPLEGIRTVVLAEADGGDVAVDGPDLEAFEVDLDVLGCGDALPARFLPCAASLPVGRLEIARVERQVGT